MELLRLLWPLFLISQILAQSCVNYGIVNGTSCECPPGLGGSTCNDPACGGNLFQGSNRQTIQATSGSTYGNLTTCQCQSGWGGVGCNVCQTASACESAYTSVFGNRAPHLADPTGLVPSDTGNTTITCSTQPRVWAAGQMSCSVQNPTLSGIFPGQSTLNILRTLDSTYALAPNVSSFGPAGYLHAILWYDGEEQFVCQAKKCNQTTTDTSADWGCESLECQCRPGATFCGKDAARNLSGVINQLGGTVDIKCSTSGGTTSCQFLQDTIKSVFGNNGLQLSGCTFGECVRQNVIDFLVSGGTNSASTNTGSEGTHLSGGVIAGLAVVGGLVLVGFLLLLWGFITQRRARQDTTAVPKTGGVTVEWKNVDYSIPSTNGALLGKSRTEDGKVILHNLSGVVRPGEMLAVLGPSGAGKTSLIDILGGKDKSGQITGTVTYTNSTGDPIKRPRIGFVDQSDVLPSMLTVQEALTFAARLRMPESVSIAEKEAKVFEVMEQLGLVDIKDTRIGSIERRGISGGEARRVSIGLELVASPDILVLDEPTSGLDSVSAVKVVQVLRELAHHPEHPTACIAAIHQPSSKLYTLFDNVLVLSRGRTIYNGAGGLVPADHFASKGYPTQPGYNVADHLLDIASEPTDNILADSRTLPAPLVRNGTSKLSGNGSENDSNPKEKVNISPEEGAVTAEQSLPQENRPALTSRMPYRSNYASTFLTQFQVLCGREWKILRRDYTLFVAHLLIASILGVFCGGLYFKTGITIAGFQSRIGCLFFLGSLLSFSALSALYNLIELRPLFLRERAGSYYSPTAWLLSRFFFDVIPLRIIPTIVVSTIVYWMAGLSPHAAHFFKYLFILVLYAATMTLFNFLLACLFRNGGIAILLSALFNLFIMTYAGFFVHLNDIPQALRWLQWFSILKYCLEALAVNEVGSGLMIQDSLQGVPVNVSAQLIMNLLFGFGANNYYRDVLVLFAFIAGFGVSLIAVVWWAVRERR